MKDINKDDLGIIVMMLSSKYHNAPMFNKMLSLMIRHITEHKQQYKITPLLKEVLEDFELYTNDEISMNKMRVLNKKLKEGGYESIKAAIQLEHWKDVLTMRTELLNMENPTIDKVNDYFMNETNCFFKLTEKEWGLQPQLIK